MKIKDIVKLVWSIIKIKFKRIQNESFIVAKDYFVTKYYILK